MCTGPRWLAAPPEAMDDDPPITEVMTTHLVGITADTPVGTALRLMASTGVRHLPVLDGSVCRGIVVEADLVRFVAGGQDPPAHRAALLVELVARAADPLPLPARRSDAARRMHAENTDVVLVTERGRLVGIVTATDLVRSLAGVHRHHESSGVRS